MTINVTAVRGLDRRYRLSAEQEAILAKNAALGRERDLLKLRRVFDAGAVYLERAKKRSTA